MTMTTDRTRTTGPTKEGCEPVDDLPMHAPVGGDGSPVDGELEELVDAERNRGPLAKRIVSSVVGVALAVVLLWWALPHFAHTSWGAVWQALTAVPVLSVVGLFGLMIAGLWLYTFTFTGSLPGLSHARAMIVNVCGSSVGNLLPGGGAAGVAVTYSQLRSWGYSRRAISTSVIVTGVWNVLARVALPIVAVLAMLFGDGGLHPAVVSAATAGAAGGIALLVAFVAVLLSERAARVLGGMVARLLSWWRVRRGGRPASAEIIVDMRRQMIDVVRYGWLPMTFGLVGFFGIYYVLFWFCLNATGVQLPFPFMFAAYAVSRLLTAVGVTPGGVGVTETATAALLVSWGAAPAQATAGVVLFSLYAHFFEVPLGMIGWLAWTMSPKVPHVDPV